MMARASTEPRQLDPSIALRLMERLTALKICGEDLSHTREANLSAIEKLLEGNASYTFGIEAVTREVEAHRLTPAGVLASVSAFTHCSPDIGVTSGPNYVSPRMCVAGLWEAAQLMRRVRDRRGSVVFGTGHSGSMINCYNRLAEYFRAHGCATPTAGGGSEVQKDWFLDFVGVTAVVTDTCGIHHTHMTAAMAAFLDALGAAPDLAIVDHGFGGECINRRLPTIVPMDTNDPGFAIAKDLGEAFVLVPMNDNRPNFLMEELAAIYIELIELAA